MHDHRSIHLRAAVGSSPVRSSVAAVALVVAAAVACHDSTGPSSDPVTLDQALAELSIPALTAAGRTFVDMSAAAPAFDSTSCAYSADEQKFICTLISERGITLRQSFTPFSVSGVKQAAFDPAQTDSVRATNVVDGTLTEGGTSVRVYGQYELTLSGLVSGPHVLDGDASIVVAGTVDDGTSTYPVNVRVNTAITKLVLPAGTAGSAVAWPSSGRIYVSVSGSTAPAALNNSSIVIQFNGTSTVGVTMTPGGGLAGAVGCTVDLAMSKPVCD